jgi:hypothetical protein
MHIFSEAGPVTGVEYRLQNGIGGDAMIERTVRDGMVGVRRNRVADGMVAAASAGVLVGGLMAVDNRVRDVITNFLEADPDRTIASATAHSQRFIDSLWKTAGHQSVGYEPLILFALVGAVFLILMMKT